MSMPHSEVKECENHQSWRDLIIGGAVMYAIIATGGKQYKVSEGDVIKVEKLDAEVGAKVTFDNVLLVEILLKLEHLPLMVRKLKLL